MSYLICSHRSIVFVSQTVDNQLLIVDAQLSQFATGASCLGQRGMLRPRDEHNFRHLRIGKLFDRSRILSTLLFQASQGAQTRSPCRTLLQKSAPCRRQLQQSQGMTSRRGIEQDMVITTHQLRIGQQARELIKRRDFRRAGSRKLFLHALHNHLGQLSSDRPDYAISIRLCGRRRVQVEGKELPDTDDGGWRVRTNFLTKHMPQIRSRVRADQEHPLASLGKMNRCGTRQRSLSNTTLPSKKQQLGRSIEQVHEFAPGMCA